MSLKQTDRQTDKATWWSITEYQPEYQDMLKDNTKWPDWVKTVYGGLEECPETKRVHFQGALQCVRQVRFSAVKQWLPKAHIEAARSKDALMQYAMKEETAVGEKSAVSNQREYWSMDRLFLEIAKHSLDYEPVIVPGHKVVDPLGYWYAVRKIIEKEPFRISSFAQPQVEKLYSNTVSVWRSLAKAAIAAGADSITPPPLESPGNVVALGGLRGP